ncbi:hypothetical protein [Fulvivirga marina]|nr:hypothetical protein [Fulvivirga marina]
MKQPIIKDKAYKDLIARLSYTMRKIEQARMNKPASNEQLKVG